MQTMATDLAKLDCLNVQTAVNLTSMVHSGQTNQAIEPCAQETLVLQELKTRQARLFADLIQTMISAEKHSGLVPECQQFCKHSPIFVQQQEKPILHKHTSFTGLDQTTMKLGGADKQLQMAMGIEACQERDKKSSLTQGKDQYISGKEDEVNQEPDSDGEDEEEGVLSGP